MSDTPVDGGDVSQLTPGEPFEDPFGPFETELESLRVALGFAFEDRSAFVEAFVEDVLSREPDERFTSAFDVLVDHLREEFGSREALESRLPDGDGEQLVREVQQILKSVRRGTLQGVFFVRSPDDHLVVAASLDAIDACIDPALADAASSDGRSPADAAVALLCRLYDVAGSGEPATSEELVRDTARAIEVLGNVDAGGAFDRDPDTASYDWVAQRVREYGAVVAYRDLDVSVNRGAELAEVPYREFVGLLDIFDVPLRTGPQSTEELHGDGLIDE